MAEAAGVAEGTIFRAFGDKESLIAAAVERYLESQPIRQRAPGESTPAQPLVDKIAPRSSILQRPIPRSDPDYVGRWAWRVRTPRSAHERRKHQERPVL